jgi:hypothetical protein
MSRRTDYLVGDRAQHVIGSLWLILDEAAAEFASAFYGRYIKGISQPKRWCKYSEN